MEHIKEQLYAEVESELETLSGLDVGSDEYKVAVEGLAKLIDRSIEIKKIELDDQAKKENRDFEREKYEAEKQEKALVRETETSMKLEQAKNDKKFKWIEIGIAVAGIVIPTGIKVWGTLKTLKFEETGTVTTLSGKAHVNSLFSKK